jgi:isopentenyldiphosphate isomerase
MADDLRPAGIAAVRAAVERAGFTLDDAVYDAVEALFVAMTAGTPAWDWLLAIAPEYGRHEYLAGLDAGGMPAKASPRMVGNHRDLVLRDARFAEWIREATTSEGSAVLLPARWLCHLTGLRHPTVQLFLDDVTEADRTLVQVRSLSRVDAPGCFDMPVAGHVPTLMHPETALLKELAEELGLDAVHITPPALLGHYEHLEGLDGSSRNNEYRTVYRCRLRPGSLARVRFSDAEVAGICLIDVGELARLIERFPDRIASGLTDSFPRYYRGQVAGGG